MEVSSKDNEIYLGIGMGKGLKKIINNAKESVEIVSPYTSADFLRDLVKLSEKGVKISLITNDEIRESSFSDFKISDIIKTKQIDDEEIKKAKKGGVIISSLTIIVSVFMTISSLLASFLFYPSMILLALSIISLTYYLAKKHYKDEYYSIFRLKVFKSISEDMRSTMLVHSKIFIIDNKVAFLGSMNFTYSGFRTHYESLIKITDKTAIESLTQEVERLFQTDELPSKSLGELVV